VTCGTIVRAGKRQGERCGRACIRGSLWCGYHHPDTVRGRVLSAQITNQETRELELQRTKRILAARAARRRVIWLREHPNRHRGSAVAPRVF
jgi:hypothetical protein